MPYKPIAVANYFIDLAKSKGDCISPMKLQKLIYYAHGWNLALKDSPLIDEQVEAWAFGPVIRSVYHKFRSYGDRPITEKESVFKLRETPNAAGLVGRWYVPSIDDEPDSAPFTKQLLDKIWDVYGGYSAIQLSNMTHQPGSPWDQTVTECKEKNGGRLLKGTDIPATVIRDYFIGMEDRRSSPR
jgi:uncharacterized phage-associated protein